MNSSNIYNQKLQNLIDKTISKHKDRKFTPTYLYIKQHTVTGKLYFGKTISSEPHKYKGSGTEWLNHIKQYGSHIETLWFCEFLDVKSIIEFALAFSYTQDIINSSEWCNKTFENGLGGGNAGTPNKNALGFKRSIESNKKISNSTKGIPKPEGFGQKLSNIIKIKGNGNNGVGEKLKGRKKPLQQNIVTAFDIELKKRVQIPCDVFNQFKNIKYVGNTSKLIKSLI